LIIQKWVDREADQHPGAKGIKLSTESIDIHDRQPRQGANREGSMVENLEIQNGIVSYRIGVEDAGLEASMSTSL